MEEKYTQADLDYLISELFKAPDWYDDIVSQVIRPSAYDGWLAVDAILKDGTTRHMYDVSVSGMREMAKMAGPKSGWSEVGIFLDVIENMSEVEWIVKGFVVPNLVRGGLIYDSIGDRWGKYWDRMAEKRLAPPGGWGPDGAVVSGPRR